MYSVEDEDDFDYLIGFVTVKASKLCLYEVLIKPTRFKVGDGLIFGCVLRRKRIASIKELIVPLQCLLVGI